MSRMLSQLQGVDKARYVGAMFARIVRHYDLMNTLMTFFQDGRWRDLAVEATLMRPGARGLDVACGTGELTFALVRGGARSAVGVDFTWEMLEAARAKEDRPGATKAHFVAGDALALPFSDNTFDVVTIGFGLRNVGDLRRCLAEMLRVVKPGGRIVSLELTHSPFLLIRLLFWPYLHLLIPLVGRIVSGDPEAYSYLPGSVARFPDAAELARLMHAVGLRSVRYRYVGLGTVAIHVGVKEGSAIEETR